MAYSKLTDVRFLSGLALVYLALQLPSLRFMARYFVYPYLSVPGFLVLSLLGTFIILRPSIKLGKVFEKAWPVIVIWTVFTFISIAVHPYADAAKLAGAGSDSDDALIIGGKALLMGVNPYRQLTYLGNPLSPGLGWILIAAPFSLTGLYSLFFPCVLGIAVICFRASGSDWRQVNQFALLTAGSLGVWELVAVGNDYLPFALLTLSIVLLLDRKDERLIISAAYIFILGVLSTCRLVFLFLPLLVGFSVARTDTFRGVTVAVGAFAVAVLCHLPFLLDTLAYPPLQLLQQKAEAIFSNTGLASATCVCVLAGSIMLFNWRKWGPSAQLAAALSAFWGIVAIADLQRVGWQLADWGGASYLIFPLPFVLFEVIKPTLTSVR